MRYVKATRTQVYFTPAQRARVDEIARSEGKTLAAVVREAVDRYVEGLPSMSAQEALDATAGTMPDLEVPSREGWDRGFG